VCVIVRCVYGMVYDVCVCGVCVCVVVWYMWYMWYVVLVIGVMLIADRGPVTVTGNLQGQFY